MHKIKFYSHINPFNCQKCVTVRVGVTVAVQSIAPSRKHQTNHIIHLMYVIFANRAVLSYLEKPREMWTTCRWVLNADNESYNTPGATRDNGARTEVALQ